MAKRKTRMTTDSIDMFAKAITQYAFRSGPIEEMHSRGQLSQNDMKSLNKFMVNRLAGLLYEMTNNEWGKVDAVFKFYHNLCTNWDTAELDLSQFIWHCKVKMKRWLPKS